MNIFYLISSILGESGGYIFDRINFKRYHIGFRPLLFLTFLGMLIFLSFFVIFTDQPTPSFTLISVLLIALIIFFSFLGNVFDYLSLKVNDLSLREPLLDFYPILAGFVGFALFPQERKPIYLLAFIAGAFVAWWGIHKVRIGRLQKKGIGCLLLSIAFYSALPSLYKEALAYLSPAYMSLLRVAGIFLLVLIFFPFKLSSAFTPKRVEYAVLSSAVAAVAAVAGIYAIQIYGVVITMLFMMLGPATRYLAGYFILKENVRRSEIMASLMLSMIVAIVAFAS